MAKWAGDQLPLDAKRILEPILEPLRQKCCTCYHGWGTDADELREDDLLSCEGHLSVLYLLVLSVLRKSVSHRNHNNNILLMVHY